LSIFESVYTAH